MIGMILNVVHDQVTVQNNNKKSQRKHKAKESKGLFTRREGYPRARVTSKQVKVSAGLQANFTGRVTLSRESTLPALVTCFVMCDIFCNGERFEIILKFSMENMLNSRKKRKIFPRCL